MRQILTALFTDEFAVSLGVCATPRGLYRALSRTPEVAAVRDALERNDIPNEELAEFYTDCLKHFTRGVNCPGEIALSALTIALETIQTQFANDAIAGLLLVSVQEMPMAPGVARCAWLTRVGKNPMGDYKVTALNLAVLGLGICPHVIVEDPEEAQDEPPHSEEGGAELHDPREGVPTADT